MSDPKDYGPMWLVDGPLTSLHERWQAGLLDERTPPHKFRDPARAERACARLNAIKPGHVVIPGIGGRAGWRAL